MRHYLKDAWGGGVLFLLVVLFSACSPYPGLDRQATPAVTRSSHPATPRATIVPTATPSISQAAPTHYDAHVLLQGVGRPDDLVLDAQGRLLFSDEINGTLNRINADGSVTTILHDPAGPEGPVALADGTIIFSEQDTNRILSLAPDATTPTLLRTLPGIPGKALCKEGVDSIALDPTTNTIIVPDSPTGVVYRMSLDGKIFTQLASGIARPTGAGIDDKGNIYIADECGHAIWQISTAGVTTRIGGFGMPDDVVPDGFGNLLVIDLAPAVHALIRFNPHTGQHETLARKGLIEPQGLLTDQQHNIFVADDYANVIVKYTPA